MTYELLTTDSDALVIRNPTKPHNALILASHRDLLELRNRIAVYLETLIPDGTLADADLPTTDDAYLSTQDAQAFARTQFDYDLNTGSLRVAISRGLVDAHKRGGRWYVQRDSLVRWMKPLISG